jgi:cytoskeletal protein CcmA (bactofilin family)
MFGSKSSKPQNRIDSLIGVGTRIEGNVTFAGGLRVDGEIKGNVRATDGQTGTLVISEQARVEGEITVSHVVVNGTVVGPVHAAEFIELQPRSRVTGDVQYNALEMHLGAVVEGRLVHKTTAADAKPSTMTEAKTAIAAQSKAAKEPESKAGTEGELTTLTAAESKPVELKLASKAS